MTTERQPRVVAGTTRGAGIAPREANVRGAGAPRAVGAALAAALALGALTGCTSGVSADPGPTPSATPTASVAPSPTPTDPGPVDLVALPVANLPDATAVVTALPVDPSPQAPVGFERITLTRAVAVSAAPGGPAVARLEAESVVGPTVVPVFERDGVWAMVPVFGRAGLPSEGVAGQAVGWIRTDDPSLVLSRDSRRVVVDLQAGTVTLVSDEGSVALDAGVGIGTADTPTPTGRTAVIAVYTDPGATYTRGLPIVAWMRFSDVDDSFLPWGRNAPAPPMAAFHFHATRGGAVSNGCVRVATEAARALGELPEGTPVIVR